MVAGDYFARLYNLRHHRVTSRLPLCAALCDTLQASHLLVEKIRESQHDAEKAVSELELNIQFAARKVVLVNCFRIELFLQTEAF